MKSYFERNILFGSAVIFFALVAVLFLVTGNKKPQENTQRTPTPSPSESSSDIPVEFTPQNGSPMKIKENTGNNTAVRYEHGMFTPHEVTITNKTGCFVEIQNAGDQNIVPRLGPYDPKKEQGFLYPSIPPTKASLIDPRYGTMATASFYDKNNPAASFIVHIDATCL